MIGPNSPTFVEGETPCEERCFGKNVALAVFYVLTNTMAIHMRVLLGPHNENHLALET